MEAKWVGYLPKAIRDRFAGRQSLQAIVSNSGWLFLDRALRLVVGLILSVWIARYLGPEAFGRLSFALAFVLLFTPLAVLGLEQIVVRELVRVPDQRVGILGSALVLRLIGAAVAITLIQIVIHVLRPEDALMWQMVALLSIGVGFQSLDVYDYWFQSRVQSKYTVAVRGTAFIVLGATKVALILLQAGLVAFVVANVAETILASIGLWLLYRRLERRNVQRMPLVLPRTRKMRELFAESWPLLVSGLAVMVYFRIDQVMLAELVGESEVGIFSAALRISEVWYAIPSVLVASAVPALVRSRDQSLSEYNMRLQKLFTVLVSIAYLVAIPITVLSNEIVTLLYGNQFDGAGPVLAIHIWSAVFVFLGVGLGPWVINEGMTKFFLCQTLIGATTNVGLNLILIPHSGAQGAAIATLASQALTAYLILSVSSKTRSIFQMQSKALLLRIS